MRDKKTALLIALVGIVAAIAIVYALTREFTLVLHPKGIMARKELHLFGIQIALMLLIIVPTFVFLFRTVYRCCFPQKREASRTYPQTILWLIPTIIVAIMGVISWHFTHELDPYKPLASDVKPLNIQVVALDWKWLFIYPEQGIASVNWVEFPANTPIHFSLAADDSPMNSFWIPELSGQIYSMTGMSTSLHLMADGPGSYRGRAAEINGVGYADMTFVAKSTDAEEFANWVESVKQSPLQLTHAAYEELLKRSINHPVTTYSFVEDRLYHTIMMKYMYHP